MVEHQYGDQGIVTNVTVEPDQHNLYRLTVQAQYGVHQSFLLTASAAHALWEHLTATLYPDSGEQFVPDVIVTTTSPEVDPHVTYKMGVRVRQDGLIEAGGVTNSGWWTLHFEQDEGDSLWAALGYALGTLSEQSDEHAYNAPTIVARSGAEEGPLRAGSYHILGHVSNLSIRRNAHRPDTFLLGSVTAEGERIAIPITDGAARILWAQVTKILYPRAADQLTQRAETVARKLPGDPTVAYVISVKFRPEDGMIEVGGASRSSGWTMEFTRGEGDELWASLEHVFGHVGRGG